MDERASWPWKPRPKVCTQFRPPGDSTSTAEWNAPREMARPCEETSARDISPHTCDIITGIAAGSSFLGSTQSNGQHILDARRVFAFELHSDHAQWSRERACSSALLHWRTKCRSRTKLSRPSGFIRAICKPCSSVNSFAAAMRWTTPERWKNLRGSES